MREAGNRIRSELVAGLGQSGKLEARGKDMAKASIMPVKLSDACPERSRRDEVRPAGKQCAENVLTEHDA